VVNEKLPLILLMTALFSNMLMLPALAGAAVLLPLLDTKS
jgi:hypothetical protein